MSFETECFSMYSDMSSRIRDSTDSNISFAKHLTSSVLPTPVEPTKMNDTGRFLGEMPTRFLRMAAVTARMASSCPTMCSLRRVSRFSSCSYSCARILLAGIFVQSSMIRARFSIVRTGFGSSSSTAISFSSCNLRLRSSAMRAKSASALSGWSISAPSSSSISA